MSAISATFNEQLNTAFFKEFTSTNPSTDSLFARVKTISLHSLNTGILILSVNDPEETRYRQIPLNLRNELNEAIINNSSVNGLIAQIMQEMRTNPQLYLLT